MQDLFNLVAHTEVPITLMLGAGVSMDAGLPSWTRLVDNLIELLPEEARDLWADSIREDRDELTRKSENLIRMINPDPAAMEHTLAKGLYLNWNGAGGPLADALARLALALGPSRCRVLTTNFDCLFRDALRRLDPGAAIHSYSLDETNGVFADDGAFHIVHLHGILEPGEHPRGPVIFTESQFLHHGQQARSIVLNHLQRRYVVFAGVSFTDPNLIAPLWDAGRAQKERDGSSDEDFPTPYGVSVAAAPAGSKHPEDTPVYMIGRSNYLSEKFGFKTVYLKSYAQVPQLFNDLALAKRHPAEYFSDDASTSFRYGFRLRRTLDQIYQNLGCDNGDDLPGGEAGAKLQQRLFGFLYGENGLASELAEIVENLRTAQQTTLQDLYKRAAPSLGNEHFGLFLWLRSRSNFGQDGEYELRLMGTSTYVHQEGWSLDRVCKVEPSSRHVAAQAAFRGQTILHKFERVADWKLWGSCLAVPFTVGGLMDLDEAVHARNSTVGAGVITLNSTQPSQTGSVSLLKVLQSRQSASVSRRLQEIAVKVVSSPL